MDIGGGDPWWWQAAASRLSVEYAVIAVVCAVLITLACRALVRLRTPLPLGEGGRLAGRVRGSPNREGQGNGDDPTNSKIPSPQPSPKGRGGKTLLGSGGSATMEFVLVFPILLFFSLLLLQTTLLAGDNAFIHYAAFTATRAAIVQVPTGYAPDESPNVVINTDGHAKHDAIRRAAVFALIPVSGLLTGSDTVPTSGSPDDFAAGLTKYYTAYGQTPPAWIASVTGDRLRYADANTMVSVMSTTVTSDGRVVFTDLPTDGAAYTFGPRDPVTVRVTHRLHLAVPYIGKLFADGVLDPTRGSGRYSLVSAQSTLTNEGVYDDLPPKPDVPRAP